MRRRRRRILPGDYLPLGQRGPRGAVRVQTAALNVVLLCCCRRCCCRQNSQAGLLRSCGTEPSAEVQQHVPLREALAVREFQLQQRPYAWEHGIKCQFPQQR